MPMEIMGRRYQHKITLQALSMCCRPHWKMIYSRIGSKERDKGSDHVVNDNEAKSYTEKSEQKKKIHTSFREDVINLKVSKFAEDAILNDIFII